MKKASVRAMRQFCHPKNLDKQRKEKFSQKIKISILVPLYNTNTFFLTAMLRSVLEQTYENWELCLADGSDIIDRNIQSEIMEIAGNDQRIKYKKLGTNNGISQNTNVALEMSTGDYIAMLDHDDALHPSALYEVMKAICDLGADFIYTDESTFQDRLEDAYSPHFKPDYAPDTLRSYNYICHLLVFNKDLLKRTCAFRKEFDGSQDYDMVLRLSEIAERIVHIPKPLYYWRAHASSAALDVAAKPYALDAAKRALEEHLKRIKLEGKVCDAKIPSTYRIQYSLCGNPKISIIIPNKDHVEDLSRCIESVQKSTYRNFEIIIVENNSVEEKTFQYYKDVIKQYQNVQVIKWEYDFNYSKINNFGIEHAKGEHIVFLNNDIKIITPDWLEQMLMFSQRADIGAVGIMLYYPNDTIQHAGVILGIGGVAGHSHRHFKRGENGYALRLGIVQNLSAVTAACMMVRAEVLNQIHGFDGNFAVAFNDIDLCMRMRKAGYLNVWTPYAEAYHYESKSRGREDTYEKQKRFNGEVLKFLERWGDELKKGDPYYNINLTLKEENFKVSVN